MKIKTISIVDYAGAKAGSDYYTNSLGNSFVNHGIDVVVLSNFSFQNSNHLSYTKVYNLKVKNVILKVFDAFYGSLKACIIIKKANCGFAINHLFSSGFFSFFQYLLLFIFRIKVITIVHDVSGFGNKDIAFFRKLILNYFSNFLVIHNEFSFNELTRLNIVQDRLKVKIIKHGGFLSDNIEVIDQQFVHRYFDFDQDFNYLLFFGQIQNEKGLDILLNAFTKVEGKNKLIIAGRPSSGLSFAKYKLLINELGIESKVILLIRFIEDFERDYLFSICKALILPYKVIYQSGVLLMAMSKGIPVIASDLEPNKEIIENKFNGILFKSEDAQDLAIKIRDYLDNLNQYYLYFRENALNTIREEYSWNDIAKKYLEFIEKNENSNPWNKRHSK